MFVAPLFRSFVDEEWEVTHWVTSFPLGCFSEMKLDEDSNCLEMVFSLKRICKLTAYNTGQEQVSVKVTVFLNSYC
jgi:hypothetical protein